MKLAVPFTILMTSCLILSACREKRTNDLPSAEQDVPEIPHIHSVAPAKIQPQEKDTSTIWYDDFNSARTYLESAGSIDPSESFGTGGGSMKAGFNKGDVNGAGNRKLAFGDFPSGVNVVNAGKHYDEIYWRIYVKHEYGWQGAPAKLSRATSIVSGKWQQAMIVHVWSGDANSLTLDPASGVLGQSDSIVTEGYNDFTHLKWLGNKPNTSFQISSADESGYWVLVEASAKLNTPGASDGSCRLWIDGRLETERINLNFRGSYAGHGINAVFLESYWNEGAFKTEGRWYDNFVVSTKPIGPITCSVNPVLRKTAWHGPDSMEDWEVELSSDNTGGDIVYRSTGQGSRAELTVDSQSGNFAGSLIGNTHLINGAEYFCRVRQKSSNGKWSAWSRWHQPFITVADKPVAR
jgi:hypothetical protein